MTAAALKMTERQVLDLLRARHVRPGNGGSGEFAYVEHVRNGAGFDSNRTFDAVVMSLWPSRGLELHAFEVKVSRGDWLRELKDPAKADAAAKVCDRFSLVVSDPAIVAEGELPPTWGLLVVKGGRMQCVKAAPLLPDANPKKGISRSFLVALLRANGAVPVAEAAEIEQARIQAAQEAREAAQEANTQWRRQYEELVAKVRRFEHASGVHIAHGGDQQVDQMAAAVRAYLEGDSAVLQARNRIESARAQLTHSADHLGKLLEGGAW